MSMLGKVLEGYKLEIERLQKLVKEQAAEIELLRRQTNVGI